MQPWINHFHTRSALFSSCHQMVGWPDWHSWPTIDELNQLIPENFVNSQNMPLSFWAEDEALPHAGMYYEERIYHHGMISTRIGNWHDLFNAFIWLSFSRTKSVINQIHVQELQQQTSRQRSKRRDLLTHFDESGVIVAYYDEGFKEALTEHNWESVFINRREQWHKQIVPFVFGHGLLEKALDPYLGFTGKALLIKVEQSFIESDLQSQRLWLDKAIAAGIKSGDLLADKTELTPLPLLGVPGWWEANCDPEFYNNTDYFRPPRKKKT